MKAKTMPQSFLPRKWVIFFCTLFICLGSQLALASSDILPPTHKPRILTPDQAFQLSVSYDTESVSLNWHIDACCYLYQEHFQVFLHKPNREPVELTGKVTLPTAETHNDPDLGPQLLYRSKVIVPVMLKPILSTIKNPQQWLLQVDSQGCATSGFCYPPQSSWFKIQVKDQKIQSLEPLTSEPPLPLLGEDPDEEKAAAPTSTAQQLRALIVPDLNQPLHGLGYLTALITFYVIGVLLTFTPCVLPMIPILATVIVGQEHVNTRKAFWLSLCYSLSMAVTYAMIGIVAALIGKNLQALMQKPVIIMAFAALFFYLGLTQLGKIQFSLFKTFKDQLNQYHIQQESGSYIGAIMMGFLATLIASPCVTAPLLGVLGYISRSGDIILGGSALLALGLGMGTILVIAGTVGGRYIPDTGPWMHSVNQAFAIMMFGLSIWLVSRIWPGGPWILGLWAVLMVYVAYCLGTFKPQSTRLGKIGVLFILYAAILGWGAFLGQTDPLKPLARFDPWHESPATIAAKKAAESGEVFRTIENLSALEAIQYYSRQEKKPTMVVFYADWCASCQRLEKNLFSSPKIVSELKNWTLVRANVTAYSDDSQNLMKHFNLIGPPAILFFDQEGKELPQYRIVGETSENRFLGTVTAACKKLNED